MLAKRGAARVIVFCNKIESCRDVENHLRRSDGSDKKYRVSPVGENVWKGQGGRVGGGGSACALLTCLLPLSPDCSSTALPAHLPYLLPCFFICLPFPPACSCSSPSPLPADHPQVAVYHEAIRADLRTEALSTFLQPVKAGELPVVLVATDRMSRGEAQALAARHSHA